MKHRAVRVIFLLLAVAAAGAAAYSIFTLEQRSTVERVGQQVIREHTRSILAALSELRGSQRGYVATGQGHPFWTARVTKLLEAVDVRVRELRTAVRSEAAVSAVDSAAVALDNFRKLDARAQEYVSLNQPLLASDLIFSDGLEITGAAAAQIETALTQEIQARARNLAMLRRQEIWAAAGAGGVLLLVTLILTPVPGGRDQMVEQRGLEETPSETASIGLREDAAFQSPIAEPEPVPDLAGAARLCTEFGRVIETRELPPLLARAAEILDAAGLVIWVSDRSGVELRPVLAHGYSEKVVAQMHGIPRDAQNAAALAYRSAQLRVVSSTDLANGAVVVPLITPAGCVGVFAAELRHGNEQHESTRALATILAAQLATLIGAAPSAGAAQARA